MFGIGEKVVVKNEVGYIRFIGPTKFAPGVWYGVELITENGRNNGTVDGTKYFECKPNFGIFVRQGLLKKDETAVPMERAGVSTPSGPRDSNLHKIIDKLQAKLQNTTQDIRLYKDKIKLLEESLISHNENITTLEAQLEMVTIDKEFETSSRSKMDLEMNKIKQQYEELKTDYQILQEEIELNKQIESEIQAQMDLENPSDLDIRTILQRNKQLEISLINLEKISTQSEENFKKQIEHLSTDILQKDGTVRDFTKTNEQLVQSELKINSLQTQLDSTLELEKVIEHLNFENEKLTARITSLENTISELNELHELDRSLEENQHLVESDLRNDLKSLLDVIKEDKLVIRNLEKTNKYIESKLSEFRNDANVTSDNKAEFFEDYSDLNNEIDSLKLELFNYKSLNFQNQLASKLTQVKLNLLQEKISLSNYLQFKSQYDLIFYLKLLVANSELVIDRIRTSPNPDYLAMQLNAIRTLSHFLRCIVYLLESNHSTNFMLNNLASLQDLATTLDYSLTGLIDLIVKESNLNSLNCDFVYTFIRGVSEIIAATDQEAFNFFNVTQLSFIFGVIHDICVSSNLVINTLRNSLEDCPSPPQSMSTLVSLSKTLIEVELDTKTHLNLELNFQNELDLKVEIDFIMFTKEISLLTKSLSDFIQEVNLPSGMEADALAQYLETTSLNELAKSIHSTLNKFKEYNSIEYIVQAKDVETIYESLNTSDNETKNPEGIQSTEKLEVSLLEKDKKLHDLQLNIQLLEINMTSINQLHDEKVKKLLSELSKIKIKYDESEVRIFELTNSNTKLTNELNEMIKSNEVFENGELAGNFDTMSNEKFFSNKMKFMEEIIMLRKLATHNFDHQVNSNESVRWLEMPLTRSKVDISNSKALEFDYASKSLRSLAINSKAVKLEKQSGWKPRATASKFVSLALQEEAFKYYNNRDHLLRSLPNRSQ